MKIFAFVFARGGSKGVPDKNIKKLNGKPLILYSLEAAKKIRQIKNCFVSTDSKKIAKIAQKFGATVIMRPKQFAKDSSPEWDAWCHAIKWVYNKIGKFDRFISLPTTSPFRNLTDIKKCLIALDKKTDFVITVSAARRNPKFNMVKMNENSYVKLLDNSGKLMIRRQDTKQIYDMTTVGYVSRPNFILKNKNFWQGNVRAVLIPEQRAIDIDTLLDFKISDLLMKKIQKKNVKK